MRTKISTARAATIAITAQAIWRWPVASHPLA
ncbi:hypothetical protein QE410_003271 [Microbacterium sp. SORGH_AS 1204]|nr:hypothetical protein [Microbacterium sp. SORGH_AS_1204]